MVSYAADVAGVNRATVYRRKDGDSDFAEAFEAAQADSCDVLEQEGFRRAHDGVEEPLVSAGRLVLDPAGQPLMVRRYSDRLLEFLLKARDPKRFSERHRLEHSGEINRGITIQDLVRLADSASPEELEAE